MAEQRSTRRHLRHDHEFRVQFRPQGSEAEYEAAGTKLSAGGFLLSSEHPQPVGARLELRFLTPARGFIAEGEVMHSSTAGMGIRFLSTSELVAQILMPELDSDEVMPGDEQLAEDLGIYRVQYRSRDELHRDYLRHLRAGGILVSTNRPAALGNEVEVRLTVDGVDLPPVKLRGRVIAPLPQGMGVEIQNLQTVEEDLLRLVGLPTWV